MVAAGAARTRPGRRARGRTGASARGGRGVRVGSGGVGGMVNAGVLVLVFGLVAVAAILLVIRLSRLK
ncbi:hypothetical protein GCM10023085_59040 [Actinomadura viridis]